MSEILTKNVMLPAKVVKATRLSPKILVLYGVPKVGKTKVLTDLGDECLIMDTEDGTAMYDCMSVSIPSAAALDKLVEAIREEGKARKAAGKTGDDIYPYRYGAIDTLDKLEEIAEIEATRKYKASNLCSKEFKAEGKTVTELPHGLGYYYLREELLLMINKLAPLFRYLILVVHVKEKLLDKKGEQVKVNDISLTGKLGMMVCAKADAIGYLSREGDTLQVSFQTSESHVMGARQPHLAGKKFQFDWKQIYID
jgi:AAA domain